MTVQELIDVLQTAPNKDAEVSCLYGELDYDLIQKVEVHKGCVHIYYGEDE